MGKYVVKKTASGGYMFNLKANNGEIIATSEDYTTLDNCLQGCEAVRSAAPQAEVEDQTVEGAPVLKHPKFEMYVDRAGEFRFRLKARNGQIIAASEGYVRKAGCENGIDSVKRNADSEVEVIQE
ncbi:MAG: YegP family protein [Clostridiaceae bacterium]|nr:YegP family protein [Clostridiaceae bacterium]